MLNLRSFSVVMLLAFCLSALTTPGYTNKENVPNVANVSSSPKPSKSKPQSDDYSPVKEMKRQLIKLRKALARVGTNSSGKKIRVPLPTVRSLLTGHLPDYPQIEFNDETVLLTGLYAPNQSTYDSRQQKFVTNLQRMQEGSAPICYRPYFLEVLHDFFGTCGEAALDRYSDQIDPQVVQSIVDGELDLARTEQIRSSLSYSQIQEIISTYTSSQLEEIRREYTPEFLAAMSRIVSKWKIEIHHTDQRMRGLAVLLIVSGIHRGWDTPILADISGEHIDLKRVFMSREEADAYMQGYEGDAKLVLLKDVLHTLQRSHIDRGDFRKWRTAFWKSRYEQLRHLAPSSLQVRSTTTKSRPTKKTTRRKLKLPIKAAPPSTPPLRSPIMTRSRSKEAVLSSSHAETTPIFVIQADD